MNRNRHEAGAPATTTLILVCMACAFIQFSTRWQRPIECQTAHIADDAFYYFQIAWNRANGRGWTFDGENPTTGFHIAYAALLAAAQKLFSLPRTDMLRAGLALSAGAFILSTGIAYCAARKLCGQMPALALAVLWSASSYNFRAVLSGMESGLVLLATSVFWYLFLGSDGPPCRNTVVSRISLFVAGIAVVLVRTDLIFLLLAACAPLLLDFRGGISGSSASGRRITSALAEALAPLFTGMLIVSVFCLSVTGFMTQDSGHAKRLAETALAPSDTTARFAESSWRFCRSLRDPFCAFLGYWPTRRYAVASVLSASAVFSALGIFAVVRLVQRRESRHWRVPLVVLSHIALFAGYQGFVGGEVQHVWYFAQTQCGVLMLIAFALGQAEIAQPRRTASDSAAPPLRLHAFHPVTACALGCCMLPAYFWCKWNEDYVGAWQYQIETYLAAKTIDAIVPASDTIGSWNAGVIGFYSHRRVVNLDGLVNAEVRAYAPQKKLQDYIANERIRWIADWPYQIESLSPRVTGPPLEWSKSNLSEAAHIEASDAPWGGRHMTIWRVRDSDDAGGGRLCSSDNTCADSAEGRESPGPSGVVETTNMQVKRTLSGIKFDRGAYGRNHDVRLKFDSPPESGISIEILDFRGMQLAVKTVDKDNCNQPVWNTGDSPPGICVVRLNPADSPAVELSMNIWSDPPRTGACAHRGDRKCYPENTLSAFRSAIEKGAHQIEFDVAMTKDGQLIIMHDDTVDRTTDGKGKISGLTLEQIKALDAGIRMGDRFKGEPVPTLREALGVLSRNVLVNVHLKSGPNLGAKAAEEIAAAGRQRQCFLACNAAQSREARRVCPGLRICNMERQFTNGGYPELTIKLGAEFIQLFGWIDCSPKTVQQLHDHGVTVNYFGASDEPTIRQLVECGIDYILTDDLDLCLKVLGDYGIKPLTPVH